MTPNLAGTILATVFLGVGTGAFTAPNTSSIMSAVEPEKRGVASALRMLAFNVGFLASFNMSLFTLVQYPPYETGTQIILSGEAGGFEGYVGNMDTALSKSFMIQALVMASAIPFTLTRYKTLLPSRGRGPSLRSK